MKKGFCLPVTCLLKKRYMATKAGRITGVVLTLLLLLTAVVPVAVHPGVVYAADTFTKLADPDPEDLPTGDGNGVAFSHDSTYLAVAHVTTPYVTIYKRSGDNFTKLTDPDDLPANSGYGIAFSDNATYMTVAHLTSPYVTIYKRSSDNFTKLADPTTLPTGDGWGVAFSPDSTYMTVAHVTTPYATIYKRNSDNFTKLAGQPTTLPAGNGYGVACSPNSTYTAVAHNTSPYVTIYKQSSDNFTKLTNPLNLPNGIGVDVAFNHDSTLMAVAHYFIPYVTIYKRSDDTFTKLADPDDLPASNGFGVAFSHDSTYLAVAHQTSPYVTIYKRGVTERLVGTETAGDGSTGANKLTLCRFEATQTGRMNQIRIYSRASGDVKVAIYTDNAGLPGTLLNSNNTATAVTENQWNEIYISPTTVTSGTTYWLAAVGNVTGALSHNKALGSGTSRGKSVTFSSFKFPKTIGTTGWTSYTYERAFAGWMDIDPPITQQLVGTTTAGNGSTGYNKLIHCKFQATQTGTVNGISVYSRANGNVKVAIYTDSSGAPGTLLNGNSRPTAVTAGQWNNIYISPTPITSGTWYWLAAVGSTNGAISYITPGTGTSRGKGATFSSFVFPKSAGTGYTSYTYERPYAGWGTAP